MRILIADDDAICRALLEDLLMEWGHDVVAVADGIAAWQILQSAESPSLAVLDWVMPGLDGVKVCQKTRALARTPSPHLILLTSRNEKGSVVAGLQSGADDYVQKPFDPDELHARIDVGIRIAVLQSALDERVRELEAALIQVKRLQGILPICSYCRKVRNDQNYWQQVENYITEHSEVLFSHGICPECFPKAMEAARKELGIRVDVHSQTIKPASEQDQPETGKGGPDQAASQDSQ